MPNPRYRKGYRAERIVRDMLALDFPLVIRAGGSRGPVDLAAIRTNARCRQCGNNAVVRLVQVKAGPKKPAAGVGDIEVAWHHQGVVDWL